MKVVAFSCVHWMTRQLQVNVYEYEEPLDYSPFLELCALIIDMKPDVVVNLGDFTETFWEEPPLLPAIYTNLPAFTELVKLRGNHDRDDGVEMVVLDGIRYEHGHKLGMLGSDGWVEGYVEALRSNTKGLKLVHGHTHVPQEAWPLDVGSVTFSRTYGEILDGVPILRRLK